MNCGENLLSPTRKPPCAPASCWLRLEERELRLAVKKGDYVSIEEVRQTWTRLIGRAKELLRNKFENELPPILSGLDATAIQEESRRAIDEVLSVLHSGG
jgi:hypothetical protein